MTCAVCCPGPSLNLFPGGYELTIGVNRAPLIVKPRCDWWAVTDFNVVEKYHVPYPVKIWTKRETAEQLGLHGMVYEDISDDFDHKTGWRTFTALASLVLGSYLGAKQIDLYGADMRGTKDADGHEYEGPQTRNEERWASERISLERVCAMLRTKGTTVNRII